MEMNLVEIGLMVATTLLTTYGYKIPRALPYLIQANEIFKKFYEFNKDGKWTQKEKAEFFDEVVVAIQLFKEGMSILIGFLPNKSKI